MLSLRLTAIGCLLLSSSCALLTDTRPSRDRSGGFLGEAPVIKAPETDRCENFGKTAVQARCEEAKHLASAYVRKLSPGDHVCLEGGFGEEVGAGCEARAAVADVDVARTLMEIRDAQPQSRWYKYVQHQIWFEEGALIDLYLVERGY